MKGFFRRDLCLLRLGVWFYPVLLAAVLAISKFFAWAGISNYMVYFLILFGVESLQSLMSYDGMNGWLSYAAAVSGGRKAMVDARYLLALPMTLILAAAIVLWTLLQGESLPLWCAGFYTSAFLFTICVTLPIGYRWGYFGVRGRLTVTVVTFTLLGVLGGIFTGILEGARADLARGDLRPDAGGFFTALSLALPLLGLGTLALSWRLSRHIMEKKEF